MQRELDIKTDRLMRLMNGSGFGGILLNSQHNFSWITGGASNGIDLTRDNGAASVLITKDGKRFVLANNIEMNRLLAEQVSGEDFEPVVYSWQDERSGAEFIDRTVGKLADGGVASDMALSPNFKLIENDIASCRYSLTIEEVERYRSLGKDCGRIIGSVLRTAEPGQTEAEIASSMRAEFQKHGISLAVCLVGADERREEYRHPVPSENVFRRSLLLVACARRGGLTACLSRLATVGPASKELRERTNSAAFVNATLWAAISEGADGRSLYEKAAKAYEEIGTPDEINKHHQGGATGYRTRDWVAHPGSRDVVNRDQAFAWNPSLRGTKVEETVIFHDGCVQTLTTTPDHPEIVHQVDGLEFSSPGILEI